MRFFFHLAILGILGAGALHCSADASVGPDDLDGGTSSGDASAGEEDADAPDAVTEDADSAAADAGPCSLDGWCRTPLPIRDAMLTAVWSFGADDAIAASQTKLLRWDGTKWSTLDAPEAEGLTSLWASTPNDIWGVARDNFKLVHGTRSAVGQPFTWSKTEFDPSVSPSMSIIRGLGSDELWVYGMDPTGQWVLQRGTIASGDDGGAPTITWSAIPIQAEISATSFWVTPGRELWVAGNGFGFAGAVALGVPSTADPSRYDWTEALSAPAGLHGMTAIWGENASEVWSVGSPGRNFRGGLAQDGGVGWVPVASHANTALFGIWGSRRDDVWIVGEAGAVRHWDGTRWSVSRLAVGGIPMWQDLVAIHGGPDHDVWAVGNGVALHHLPGAAP